MRGYVAHEFLSAKPLREDELIAEADRLEKTDHVREALRFIERAAEIENSDRALLERLIEAALKAGEYRTAVRASMALREGGVLDGRIELELAYGCRGDRTKAEWIEPDTITSLELARAPKNACAKDVHVDPPCAERDTGAPNEQEKREALVAEHAAHLARVGEAFGDPPYLRATIYGTRDLRTRRTKLYAYAIAYTVKIDCDRVFIERGRVHILEQTIRWPAPGEETDAWIALPAYDGYLFGLVSSIDRATAEAQIDELRKESELGNTPESLGPDSRIFAPYAACTAACEPNPTETDGRRVTQLLITRAQFC